jgi:predicted transcriptional regulator
VIGIGQATMVLKQGDLENIILNALWDLDAEGLDPVYVSHVQERICKAEKNWAYTTVKTVLDRLVDKGDASRERHGKKYSYKASVQRADAGIYAIEKVIRQYFCNDMDALSACLAQLKTEKKAPQQVNG